MAETVPTYDIVLIKGRSWSRRLTFNDFDGTGCVLKMTLVRNWDDATKVLELSSPATGITVAEVAAADVWVSDTVTLDGARGETLNIVEGDWQADIDITAAQVAELTGTYFYDIKLEGPSDAYDDPILRGKVTVLGRATA